VTDAAAAPSPAGTPTLPGGQPVLEGRHLLKTFRLGGVAGRGRSVHAVNDVSLALYRGRVLALVGESGSGKSTVARLLSGLERPTGGEILLDGKTVSLRRRHDFRRYKRSVQMILQDPYASLNSVHSIRHHLARPLRIHAEVQRRGASVDELLVELLEQVRLTPAELYLDKYPHELSGGQRQRIAIARALAARPAVLLADEPISMLDVSIRLGVLNLLDDLRSRLDLAVLYITHDIASARYFAEETMVMYAGEVVETGPSEELTQSPAHPYTQLLLASSPDPDRLTRDTAEGDRPLGSPPSLVDPPPGCRFHPRCPFAMEVCRREVPPAVEVAPGRHARCWLHDPGRGAPVSEAASPSAS